MFIRPPLVVELRMYTTYRFRREIRTSFANGKQAYARHVVTWMNVNMAESMRAAAKSWCGTTERNIDSEFEVD